MAELKIFWKKFLVGVFEDFSGEKREKRGKFGF